MKFRNTSDSDNNQNTAREAAILQNIDLAKRIAKAMLRRLPPCVTLDDLTGAGMIGLIQAVDRFDRARGLEFSTYARHRIRGAMQDFLRGEDPLSRAERVRIRANSGAAATVNVSLDSVPPSRTPAAHPDFALRTEVHKARRCLSARENRVIGMLFDLGLQNQEIAAALKVNPSRVSQIKQQAILKLRRRLQAGYRGRAA